MKIRFLSAASIALLLLVPIYAHDLFLRLDTYFVKPNEKVQIKILNGSFQASEGAVSFARLADLSMVLPSGERSKASEADFSKDEKTSYLAVTPALPGTYVVGLSTMHREIDLAGKDFNEYLEHDGIPDTLVERKQKNEMEKAVRERYSKHVKTIFQAGDARSRNYKIAFGYPVEIVPRSNPYDLGVGDTFEFLCLKDGKPIANQYVMSGYDDGTNHRMSENVRTDKKGIGRIRLSSAGKWYVKFIHMTRLDDPKLNYESKWASLSFEIR